MFQRFFQIQYICVCTIYHCKQQTERIEMGDAPLCLLFYVQDSCEMFFSSIHYVCMCHILHPAIREYALKGSQ